MRYLTDVRPLCYPHPCHSDRILHTQQDRACLVEYHEIIISAIGFGRELRPYPPHEPFLVLLRACLPLSDHIILGRTHLHQSPPGDRHAFVPVSPYRAFRPVFCQSVHISDSPVSGLSDSSSSSSSSSSPVELTLFISRFAHISNRSVVTVTPFLTDCIASSSMVPFVDSQ